MSTPLKFTVGRLIPVGTPFTHYDPADSCLVSPTGWRLPVFAHTRPGDTVLSFVIDVEREPTCRPDLCTVPGDSDEQN